MNDSLTFKDSKLWLSQVVPNGQSNGHRMAFYPKK